MEAQNNPNFDNIDEDRKQLLQAKEYEFQINTNKYILKIDTYTNQTMRFNIKQTNNITIYYYEKNYNYDDITKTLKLLKDYYNDISKIFEFYDTAITMKKVTLKEDREKKQMILQLEKQLDFVTMQCNIELIQRQINNEEMFAIITEQINEWKNKEINNQSNQQIKDQDNDQRFKQLEEKIKQIENDTSREVIQYKQIAEQYQKEINQLKQDIKDLKEEVKRIDLIIDNNKTTIKCELDRQIEIIKQIKDTTEKDKNELIKDINIIKEEIKKINKILENNNDFIKKMKEEQKNKIEAKHKKFKDDPCYLNYKIDIANNNSCGGALCNFDLFKGIKDNIEYIIFNNKNNYNIEIMRINDKIIISSLKGHNNRTRVIRYYIKDNNEEYILSCDYNKLVIIWDIQNNYNIKYNIKVKDSGNIYDALLLFNIFNKNYI